MDVKSQSWQRSAQACTNVISISGLLIEHMYTYVWGFRKASLPRTSMRDGGKGLIYSNLFYSNTYMLYVLSIEFMLKRFVMEPSVEVLLAMMAQLQKIIGLDPFEACSRKIVPLHNKYGYTLH